MDINEVQRAVLRLVDEWVRTQKTPITHKLILAELVETGKYPQSRVKATVRVLIHKGYLRRAITINCKGASYVQLRRLA